MKNLYLKNFVSEILCFLMISMTFQSCSISNKIYSENDIVYSTKRFELKYNVLDMDRRSPLFYFTQSFVKEINSQDEIHYTAYDVLSLSSSSFKLDEKVILIIDNETYPMDIEKIELENVRSVSESKSDISTSDSTTVSVITGYSENNRKISRLSYKIPVKTMMKIKEANQFYLRYYSGPSMITVKPKKRSINKIKQLIDIS